jgi:tRNA G18 (ribose-2'-O)-methylase SpoU
MREPNPITAAAFASGEPVFRDIGVGPWSQTHPDESRPDDDNAEHHNDRYDSELLDNGDRRNVLDGYRYWKVEAIRADLDYRGRHPFEVAVENWTHDFNIGSMVRTANAFAAMRVHIVGPHKWNRKGALMTELYQHVDHHPSIEDLVTNWHQRMDDEMHEARQAQRKITVFLDPQSNKSSLTRPLSADSPEVATQLADEQAMDMQCSDNRKLKYLHDAGNAAAEVSPSILSPLLAMDAGSPDTGVDVADTTGGTDAGGALISRRICSTIEDLYAYYVHAEQLARSSRIIALDIIPGAVPMETYQFPERCLMLFGAEGPGLSKKALELADDVVYISQFGSVRSINAGAASAVAMHSWIAQHM